MVEVDKSFVQFAKDLFKKVGKPPKVKGPSQLEIDTLKMQSKKYSMVDFDEEATEKKVKKVKRKKEKKERSLRKRKMSGDTSEEDDHRGYHQKEEIIEEDPELVLEREEQERLRDLEERDAFAKRMINKEHEMTRKRIQ